MNEFYFIWIKPADIDACSSKEVKLFKKLYHVCPSFMVNKGILNKSGRKARFYNSNTEFDIFSHSGNPVSADLLINFTRNTHVKASGMKSAYMFFISPCSTSTYRGSHSIAYRFLNRLKIWMSTIRSTISIYPMLLKVPVNSLKIVRGNDTVRVKDHKIISSGPFKAIIPAKTLSRIFLVIIPNIKPIFITVYDIFTGFIGTIFNDKRFKICVALFTKTFQELIYFLRSVINRYDY